MENLNSVLTRMQEMLDAYENRCAAAFDRMDALNSALRQEQDAMAAAAAADDMSAYREHEASMRFTTARIEAARREQVEPLFSGFEEARALAKEYSAACAAAAAPIYTRMLELINEQEELVKALQQLSNDGYATVNGIHDHAVKQGVSIYPFGVSAAFRDFPPARVRGFLADALGKGA